jgi:hypothetical protein
MDTGWSFVGLELKRAMHNWDRRFSPANADSKSVWREDGLVSRRQHIGLVLKGNCQGSEETMHGVFGALRFDDT